MTRTVQWFILSVFPVFVAGAMACAAAEDVTPTPKPAETPLGVSRTAPEILAAIRQINPTFCTGEFTPPPGARVPTTEHIAFGPSRAGSGFWYTECRRVIDAGAKEPACTFGLCTIYVCAKTNEATLETSYIAKPDDGLLFGTPCSQRPAWMQ